MIKSKLGNNNTLMTIRFDNVFYLKDAVSALRAHVSSKVHFQILTDHENTFMENQPLNKGKFVMI